ncbi:MAG: sensor histidine kinase [Acidobacteria bacterium]|nr:MAG: sensor histidine kinase [Acidobacteriota bacterium]
MNRVWSFARAHGLDALVLIAAGASALEAAFRSDPARDPDTSTWFAAPAIALLVLPLLARRRFPFAAPASVWLLAASLSFADGRLVTYSPIAFIAGFVAAFLIGNVRDAAQARIGLGLVVAAAAIVVSNDPTHDTGDFAFTPLLFAISWLAGFAMRGRAEQVEAAELRAIQAERERETAARIAVAEERARIARELHDIVAHAVSVMVLQVGAVRHGLATVDPESREALARVERTGRTALAEMRRLLGAMRDGEEVALGPQPGLSDLEPLLDQVGDAGLPVELHIDGDPRPLPEALDLTAYRIVQEGLTNALKHAHASRAEVTVRYRSGELDIEIRDDGRGATPGRGNGHGLVGVRERVKVYGGEMTAGAGSEAGFVLRTRLPLERYGE